MARMFLTEISVLSVLCPVSVIILVLTVADSVKANILIGDDSRVRISDPCLNFRMRQFTDNTYKSIPASYQYKSPEELLEPSKISHQGDVYSWASVIYEVSVI